MMSGVVEIFDQLLGPEHPNTISAKKNLAIIQQAIQRQQPNWFSRVKRRSGLGRKWLGR
jgi:hypothetical protein